MGIAYAAGMGPADRDPALTAPEHGRGWPGHRRGWPGQAAHPPAAAPPPTPATPSVVVGPILS